MADGSDVLDLPPAHGKRVLDKELDLPIRPAVCGPLNCAA